MAFADEITKNDSTRHTYAVVAPKMDLLTPTATTYSTGVKYISWPHLVTNVTGYNASGSLPVNGSTQWWYDVSTQRLYFSANGGGTYPTGVFTYQLGFTSGHYEELAYNLGTVTDANRIGFQPRLKSPPRVTEDVGDSLYGVVSISAEPLSIINTDRFYSDLFKAKSSWYNVDVTLYMNVNGSVQKMFTGTTGLITQNDGIISISLQSLHKRLKETNTYLLSSDYSTCQNVGGRTFNELDRGKAVPYYSSGSRASYTTMGSGSWWIDVDQGLSNTSYNDYKTIKCNDDDLAICTNFSTSISTSNNTIWHLGLNEYRSTYSHTHSITSVQLYREGFAWRIPQFDVNGDFLRFKTNKTIIIACGYDTTLEVGHTVYFTSFVCSGNSFGTVYSVIVNKEDVGIGYRLTALSDNFLYPGSSGLCAYGSVVAVAGPRLAIETPRGMIPLIHHVDFTYTKAAETNSDVFWEVEKHIITLVNPIQLAFDLQIPSIIGGETRIHKVLDINRTSLTDYASSTMATAFAYAGVNGNVDGIADYSTKTIHRIPHEGTASETHLTVLERLLKSIGAYIRIGTDGTFYAEYFKIPTGEDYSITEEDILIGTFSYELTYDDSYTTTYIQNQVSGTSLYRSDSFLKTLYGREYRLDMQDSNLFSPMSNTGRTAELINLLTSRRVKYQFRLPHRFLNVKIGDRIKVTHKEVMEPEGWTRGVVTRVAKSETSVSIEITDFKSSTY